MKENKHDENPVTLADMDNLIKCLALELPEDVMSFVNKKWQSFKAGYKATKNPTFYELYQDWWATIGQILFGLIVGYALAQSLFLNKKPSCGSLSFLLDCIE